MPEKIESDEKQLVEFADCFVEGLGVGGIAGNGGDEGVAECGVEGVDAVEGSAFGKVPACACSRGCGLTDRRDRSA